MGNIINDENVINGGKDEFIDRVKNAVNIDELKNFLRYKYNIDISDVDFKNGDVVSHNNSLAFKLDYDVITTFSILVDANGNSIESPENNIEEGGQQAGDVVREWDK